MNKETHDVRLLKNSKTKNGYTYHNLYLQIDGGEPIAIRLSFETRKLKNFVLACSTDCEISTRTIVAEKAKIAEDDDGPFQTANAADIKACGKKARKLGKRK